MHQLTLRLKNCNLKTIIMISDKVNSLIKPGAMVRVWEKVPAESGSDSKEKKSDKARLSKFEGLVLARKHGNEIGASFTVRTTIAGVGVEKVYPIHSPMIEKTEVISSPKKVRRAKLYYVRELSRKETQQKLRRELSAAQKIMQQALAAEKKTEPEKKEEPVPVETAQK